MSTYTEDVSMILLIIGRGIKTKDKIIVDRLEEQKIIEKIYRMRTCAQ